MRSYLTHLECSNCGATTSADQLVKLCLACGKVLLARYDLGAAAREMTPAVLSGRPWNLWRYAEVMPVRDPSFALTLGEGGTPLHEAHALSREFGYERLLVKDEGLNPTGSFKARGLCAAISRAKELGATTVAIPSAGNAGAAMAAYAARAGLQAIVVMPFETPDVIKAECRAYGATVWLIGGLINDCGKVVRVGAADHGWFDVSTLKEPYRVEGKKTMGIELAEQLGWRLPDAIIYPTGGGTGIVGMWKAFEELETMGLIGPKRPKMIVVQAEGCAPIARAFAAGKRHADLWEGAETLAPGIRVPVAIGDYLILDAVRASGGTTETVTEDEILEGMNLASRREGLFVSPESGAAFVAAKKLRERGFLRPTDETVIFSTGAGLMHPDLVPGQFMVFDSVETDDQIRESIESLLKDPEPPNPMPPLGARHLWVRFEKEMEKAEKKFDD